MKSASLLLRATVTAAVATASDSMVCMKCSSAGAHVLRCTLQSVQMSAIGMCRIMHRHDLHQTVYDGLN